MSRITSDPTDAGLGRALMNGQNESYLVLSEEERAKGFVRPIRTAYTHAGVQPRYPVRNLTPEELERHGNMNMWLMKSIQKANLRLLADSGHRSSLIAVVELSLQWPSRLLKPMHVIRNTTAARFVCNAVSIFQLQSSAG